MQPSCTGSYREPNTPCQKTVFTFGTRAMKSNQELIKVPEHTRAKSISSSPARYPKFLLHLDSFLETPTYLWRPILRVYILQIPKNTSLHIILQSHYDWALAWKRTTCRCLRGLHGSVCGRRWLPGHWRAPEKQEELGDTSNSSLVAAVTPPGLAAPLTPARAGSNLGGRMLAVPWFPKNSMG